MSIFHYYDLGFCNLFVFNDLLIHQVREVLVIIPHHSKVPYQISKNHFKDNPMVCISNKIMCCFVDTITCVVTSKTGNLIAIPIVTDNLK